MFDLVTRLRDGCGDMVRIETLRQEAADEIERLQTALRAVATWDAGPSGNTTAERSMRRIAGRAVGIETP